ncbi:hypothetical protein NC651_019454 [Populus alba x Populus x berolinensis]|nr:hypothetical protein NC651_019454 [Populus alba x Populus x berolinensis]
MSAALLHKHDAAVSTLDLEEPKDPLRVLEMFNKVKEGRWVQAQLVNLRECIIQKPGFNGNFERMRMEIDNSLEEVYIGAMKNHRSKGKVQEEDDDSDIRREMLSMSNLDNFVHKVIRVLCFPAGIIGFPIVLCWRTERPSHKYIVCFRCSFRVAGVKECGETATN